MWAHYRDGQAPAPVAGIDSTLFQSDSAVSADTATLAQDSSLTGLLARLEPELGVAKRSTGAIHSPLGDLPLYSLTLHRGRPLSAVVAQAIDSLERMGFTILESTENPRGTWPWACRLAHNGKPAAILRARVGLAPAPGVYALGLVFWADSLTAPVLATIANLPAGSVLALPAPALSETRLRDLARGANLQLALLTRLETSRFPVVRQEDKRLMLHHKEDEIRRRLAFTTEPSPAPVGLVVLDGDRGAADPGLSERLARYASGQSLWLLDATGTPASRLASTTLEKGGDILPDTRPGGQEPFGEAIQAALARAEKSGQTLLVWPLDSTTSSHLASSRASLAERGVEIRPPQPLHRHTGTGD